MDTTISPDGAWRWDGQQWVPNQPQPSMAPSAPPPPATAHQVVPLAPARVTEDRLRACLHPYEETRFQWAVIALGVIIGPLALVLLIAAPLFTMTLLPILALVFLVWWFAARTHRADLLGNAVRVTAASMPEVHRLLESSQTWLDYRRPVQIYVKTDVSGLIETFSLLGVNIILIDGDLAADLLKPGKGKRLHFLLASSVGVLKARHLRFALATMLLSGSRAATWWNPLLRAYNRATRYSGDQIAASCCESLEAGLDVIKRLMAGPEMIDAVDSDQLVLQGSLSRDNVLLRYSQYRSNSPHLTFRFLNLLCYAEQAMPEQLEAFRSRLSREAALALDGELARSPHRRPTVQPQAMPLQWGAAPSPVGQAAPMAAWSPRAQQPAPNPPTPPGPPPASASPL